MATCEVCGKQVRLVPRRDPPGAWKLHAHYCLGDNQRRVILAAADQLERVEGRWTSKDDPGLVAGARTMFSLEPRGLLKVGWAVGGAWLTEAGRRSLAALQAAEEDV